MDPRAALLQQESDENDRFRNKSIGMHNLRAKLREQLKGYSHIRGFPLGPEPSRDAKDSGRTESLGVRRDSIRRRTSSVTRQQDKYDVEDSDSERKYKPRRPRKQPSLLIPRLLWFSVYLSLCYVAYKSLQYFGSETEVSLCQACSSSSSSSCGVLDDEFVVPVDNLAGLPFGTVFPHKSSLQCRLDVCVPAHVVDPQSLCKMVSDEALLYRTRRLLQDEVTEEPNARFLEYFRRRAMREEGLAGALSPGGLPNEPARTPSPAPPSREQPTQPSTPGRGPLQGQPDAESRGQESPPRGPSGPEGGQNNRGGQGEQNLPRGGEEVARTPPRGDVPVTAVPPTSTQSPPLQAGTPPPQAGTPPPQEVPPPGFAPPPMAPSSGNLANGAYADRAGIRSVRMSDLPGGMLSGGDCTPLRFAPAEGQGYANMTSEFYMRITEVENFGQCCSICANEPSCASWTRVAGGDASVRSCYLHTVLTLDPSPGATAYNWQPRGMAVYTPHQELRYTGGVPIMFESGTKDRPYPDYVYGCPYPPSADGTCQIPAGCNCGGGICYSGCTAPNVASSADMSSSTAPSASRPA